MPLLEQVLEQYPEDVKLVFKHFPLGNHKFAGKAALATLAANEQGKFWPLHDLLFANYNRLDDETITDLARQAGLDMERFEKDMQTGVRRYTDLIRRDMIEGQRNGVRGTPTIFVNGKLLRQRSLQGFREAIEKELAKEK